MTENKTENEKVFVFIDGSNFYHGCKESLGYHDVCFSSLIKKLVGNRKLVDVIYYNAKLPLNYHGYAEQQRFFDKLRKDGIKLTFGRLNQYNKEKGVDVQIAVDMFTLAMDNIYDTAILISGDADFVNVIVPIKKRFKKKIEHAYFFSGASQLRQICDSFKVLKKEHFERCKPEGCKGKLHN